VIATIAVLLQTVPEGPDIIPDPDGEPRPTNIAGLVVAVVLLLGWALAGLLLFRRARRRP
jgi:hypothetical protein